MYTSVCTDTHTHTYIHIHTHTHTKLKVPVNFCPQVPPMCARLLRNKEEKEGEEGREALSYRDNTQVILGKLT